MSFHRTHHVLVDQLKRNVDLQPQLFQLQLCTELEVSDRMCNGNLHWHHRVLESDAVPGSSTAKNWQDKLNFLATLTDKVCATHLNGIKL